MLEIQGQVPTLDLIKQIEDLNGLVQELTAADRLPGDRRRRVAAARPVAGADGNHAERMAGQADGPHRPQRRRLPPEDQPGTPEGEGRLPTAYFNLHKKARLGANEDGKKKELLKDARLESLKKLAWRVAAAALAP